jgi:WXXGXW repeat (2 copies)
MKRKLLGLLLFAGMSVFGQISVGVHIGPPPPLRIEVRHASPGPGYSYVDGYWYPVGGHYKWHGGYWSRPPYEGAAWVGPHHDGQQYYQGYWHGAGHEDMAHDHASDRAHERDYHPPN